jgi:hypothetical protein
MLKVKFASARDGGVMAKIDGKVSFPERRGPQPKPGEEWLVEITGQNPKGTVNFLKCVRPWRGTIQDCRDLGAVEKVDRFFWKVSFYHQETCIATFSIADHRRVFPELAREMDEHMERARLEWEQYKAEAETEAAHILAKIRGHKLETRVVEATHYKVEVLTDEDWGLHKADSGFYIRVKPLYKGATGSPHRSVLNELAREYFGCNWLDVEEGAEDESMSGVQGPNRALIDLANDVVNGSYVKLTVVLTDEQIDEIDSKYAARVDRHEFDMVAEWWLKK